MTVEPLTLTAVLPQLAPHAGGAVRLEVELHPTPVDDAPLWSDVLGPQRVGEGGAVHLVLGLGRALPPSVFERFPRWLAVRVEGSDETGLRVPVTGAALRHGAALASLVGSPDRLEGDHLRMLVRMPSRLRSLSEGLDDVHSRVVALEEGASGVGDVPGLAPRLGALDARVQRTEDRLEDLLGPPHGEVVLLTQRMATLEGRLDALVSAVARLAEAFEVRPPTGRDVVGVPRGEG